MTTLPRLDLVGQRFGLWTVLSVSDNRKHHCKCDCGTEKDVATRTLIVGTSTNCGCARKLPDLIGKKFGKWTAVAIHDNTTDGRVGLFYDTMCDCGSSGVVRNSRLTGGFTKSCGCNISETHSTHGQSKSSEIRSYYHMRERCLTPTCRDYSYYGGRGIKICERWLKSSKAFLDDMGPKPFPDYTLERRDVNADYSPENCVWDSRAAQADNTRATTRYTIDGTTRTLKEWCNIHNKSVKTVRQRVKHLGLTPEEALALPTPTDFLGNPCEDYRIRRRWSIRPVSE